MKLRIGSVIFGKKLVGTFKAEYFSTDEVHVDTTVAINHINVQFDFNEIPDVNGRHQRDVVIPSDRVHTIGRVYVKSLGVNKSMTIKQNCIAGSFVPLRAYSRNGSLRVTATKGATVVNLLSNVEGLLQRFIPMTGAPGGINSGTYSTPVNWLYLWKVPSNMSGEVTFTVIAAYGKRENVALIVG